MTTQPSSENDGDWALVIHHMPNLMAVRAALGLDLGDWMRLRARLPPVLRRGTREELLPLLERLVKFKVWAELRPGSDFPEVESAASGFQPSRIPSLIRDGDFVPFDDYHYDEIPVEDLPQIRALSPARTEWVSDVLWRMVDNKTQQLASQEFDDVETISTAGDPDTVRQWLSARLTPATAKMLVSRDCGPAVITPAKVFARYWDDFCNAAADDVLAWSMNDDRAAFFHHEEQMSVGRRQKKSVGS